MRKLMTAVAAIGLGLAATCASAHTIYTPRDIGYLAIMAENNPAFFQANIMGVDQFAGSGVVHEIGGNGIVIDTGPGDVTCMPPSGTTKRDTESVWRLQVGDRVTVTGSLGSGITAAYKRQVRS